MEKLKGISLVSVLDRPNSVMFANLAFHLQLSPQRDGKLPPASEKHSPWGKIQQHHINPWMRHKYAAFIMKTCTRPFQKLGDYESFVYC